MYFAMFNLCRQLKKKVHQTIYNTVMCFTLPFTYDMDIKSKIEGWGWGQIWQLTSSWLQISLKTNKGNKSKVYGKMWGRHIVVDHSKGVGVFRIIEWLGRLVYSMTDLQFLVLFCYFIYAALFRFSIDFKKSFVLWYLSLIDFQIFLTYILVWIKFYNICNYSFEYTSTVKF